MIFSYTQIAAYLACPARYRYRYLDGWQEKDVRANMLFGRAFEKALGAYFRGNDCSQELFEQWSAYRGQPLHYSNGDTWDRMLEQGIRMLERFAQDDRVRIANPQQDLEIKLTRPLGRDNDFLGYIDAIGQLDGKRTIIDWKTTSARYPDEPEGLLALDPQLICYSWATGEPNVAFVVFVRKRLPELQYLHATISQERRDEFGQLVDHTVNQIRSAHFAPRSGIRFPQNGCISCAHVGLCLGRQQLIDTNLVRRQPTEFDWLDEIAC
jgi:PD-(D/E)XK nuclease superfamily protein